MRVRVRVYSVQEGQCDEKLIYMICTCSGTLHVNISRYDTTNEGKILFITLAFVISK